MVPVDDPSVNGDHADDLMNTSRLALSPQQVQPQTPPVQYEDVWSNISIGRIVQPPITNEFIINDNAFTIGTTSIKPKVYGYSVSGIREDEKIKNGDVRKVYVSAREPYTTNKSALVDNIQYRL